jgi:hypothetical protein
MSYSKLITPLMSEPRYTGGVIVETQSSFSAENTAAARTAAMTQEQLQSLVAPNAPYCEGNGTLPIGLLTQFGSSGLRHDYANKLLFAEHTANVARNKNEQVRMERVQHALVVLPELLRNLVTYSEYWDEQVRTEQRTSKQNIDAAAVKKCFVSNIAGARRLNGIVMELRQLGSKSNLEEALDHVLKLFEEARALLYAH